MTGGNIGTGVNFWILNNNNNNNNNISEVYHTEYFLGYIRDGVTLQDLLNSTNLSLSSGEIPVLSIGEYDATTGNYTVYKYVITLLSGNNYTPIGDFIDAKSLILIDTISPNEQTSEAALNAANAQVFDIESVNDLTELITSLNTSADPYDISNVNTIYYFRFTANEVNYIYVISEGAVRGVYGSGLLQFTQADLRLFFASNAVKDLIKDKINYPQNIPTGTEVVLLDENKTTTTLPTYEFFRVDPTLSVYATINDLINVGGYSLANGIIKGVQVLCPNLDPPRIYVRYGDNETDWKVINLNTIPIS